MEQALSPSLEAGSGDRSRLLRARDLRTAEAWLAMYSIAFSPDGRTLASVDYEGALRLWDVADLEHAPLLAGSGAAT